MTQIRGGSDSSALAAAETEEAGAEAAAASQDSNGGTGGGEDAASAGGDTVFGYVPNPEAGIVAILNPTAQLSEVLLPVYHFLRSAAEESPSRPCGPLKRAELLEDQLTLRFTRSLLLKEHHHLNSDAKRDLFSEESKTLMAVMAKQLAHIKKVKKKRDSGSPSRSGGAGVVSEARDPEGLRLCSRASPGSASAV